MLPNLLAGTINEYSTNAIPQLIKIDPKIPTSFKKGMSLKRKCPYQAIVMNVLEAMRRSMVYNGRIL